MKAIWVALLFGAGAYAQTSPVLSFYIDNSNGALPTSQLPALASPYAFPDTSVGESSSVVIRVVNSSTAQVTVTDIYVGVAQNSSSATPNFSITGFDIDATIAPQSWKLFTINFTPSTAGAAVGYLQAAVGGAIQSVATLQGNGLESGPGPELTLTCNGNAIAADTTIAFGSVSTTTNSVEQCTIVNATTAAIPVSLSTEQYNTSAFAAPALPLTVAAGATGSFSITFAPGNAGQYQATLNVGPNSDLLTGIGTGSSPGVAPLAISYVDSTGVSLNAQSATPINFGQTIAGTNGTATLTFIVTNPSTNINAVTLSNIAASGAGFATSFSASPVPPCSQAVPGSNVLQPGQCVSFQVTFSESATGTYNGTLTIGPNQFTLTGQSIVGIESTATMTVTPSPLTSQQQATLTIQAGSAPSADLIGTLTMAFASSVDGITSDPAISFAKTSGQTLQVTVPAGSQSVTYDSQPGITFQTGTTAGTITFTLTFPNSPNITQSFTIAPEMQITNMTATQEDPNLVVQIDGFDNTYSVGQLSFVFGTTTAGNITVNADETSAFHQLFFTNNTEGGAFSLQATFPVTSGTVSQVSSVTATLTNSKGQTAQQNQAF